MPKIALYLRLSVDEMDTDESNSIVNQRYLLQNYLKNSVEFQTFQQVEFVDDGFSGTNLNRPAFQRLMAGVKSGEIRYIVVKDLSRFMRDYLELGNYLENIFPFLGVRFIALNDNYDSFKSENNGLEIDVPFKNLLNEFYARDVSEKVKSAMNTMKRSGKNMSWLPPFGYLKDPNDRFKIIIDEEVEAIVKRIFKLCIEGKGLQKIALILNDENILTPAERKMQVSRARYKNSIILTKEQKRNIWTKTSVRQIIKNEAYKGTYLFNTQTTINGKRVMCPESEWERIEDHHEAIVSPKEFEEAQEALRSRATRKGKKSHGRSSEDLLRGFVFCKHCRHRLLLFKTSSKMSYFYCRYCRSQGRSMKICRSDSMEKEILDNLVDQLAVSRPKLSKTRIIGNIEQLKALKLAHFQDYKDGRISREVFLAKKEELDSEITLLETSLQAGDHVSIRVNEELSSEVVETYIEKIIVDCLGFFKIIYK